MGLAKTPISRDNSGAMVEAFSIIIPVHKDLEGLKETVQNLRSSNIPVLFEWIVVNDGANRHISDWLGDQGIKEIKIAKRQGSYNARNQGIKAAAYDYLLFVDAGVKIRPNWFQLAGDLLERKDYLSYVINVSVDESMPLSMRYSEFYEFRCEMLWNQNHFGPTAFLWVKKRVFEDTGGFDEELWSGGDLELGNRCWHANFNMAQLPNDHIWHPPRSLRAKHRKNIRVLKGIRKLRKKYPNRLMKLPAVSWKELLKSPLKFAYTLYRIRKLEAYQSGKMTISQVAWNEISHQTMYYSALFKVLLSK